MRFYLGKRKRRADDEAVNEITKQLEKCNISVSDISLEVRSCMHYLTFWFNFNLWRFSGNKLKYSVEDASYKI